MLVIHLLLSVIWLPSEGVLGSRSSGETSRSAVEEDNSLSPRVIEHVMPPSTPTPPPSREPSPRQNSSLSSTHPEKTPSRREQAFAGKSRSLTNSPASLSKTSSSAKMTRIECGKGVVFSLSRGESKELINGSNVDRNMSLSPPSTTNAPLDSLVSSKANHSSSYSSSTSSNQQSLSSSQPNLLKRSLRSSVSKGSDISPESLSNLIQRSSDLFDPENCGWTWYGLGENRTLQMTVQNIPVGHALVFVVGLSRARAGSVRNSIDSPSSTSSTNESESDESPETLKFYKVGHLGGRTLTVSVSDLEKVYDIAVNDRVDVNCFLLRVHDQAIATFIGERVLKKNSADDWSMLELSVTVDVDIKDIGHGYSIKLKKLLPKRRALVVIQDLNTRKMQVGRTRDRSFVVYRRPLETDYDARIECSFSLILVDKYIEDASEVVDNLGTSRARPLRTFSLPLGYRLCSLPIYFEINNSWTESFMTMNCIDPSLDQLKLVFFKKTLIEESNQFKLEAINFLETKEKVLKIPLYRRKGDCYSKRYVVLVYGVTCKELDLDQYIGFFRIPFNRTWCKTIDYEDNNDETGNSEGGAETDTDEEEDIDDEEEQDFTF